MTGGTVLLGMGADQLIAGLCTVIKTYLPGFLAMAITALRSITAEMRIVTGVTALTVRRQATVIRFRDMTISAYERFMGTTQRETGFRFVFEIGVAGFAAVAIATIVSSGTTMGVVEAMAVDAGSTRRLE